MRIALKHQILMAPAAVLLLMTLLLCFLQYTNHDLSQKREQLQKKGTIILSLTQANMAAQRMFDLARQYELRSAEFLIDDIEVKELLERLEEMHAHLAVAVQRIVPLMNLEQNKVEQLYKTVDVLNPRRGLDLTQFLADMAKLQPQLAELSSITKQMHEAAQPVTTKELDKLIDRAALVSVIVLGAAIPIGILLSLYF
ncbi:MAG: hypothetical protein C0614_05685, partial [Desulfuromonas sp.]